MKKRLPKFRSEAEEAAWWDNNQEKAAAWLEEAAAKGQLRSVEDVVKLPPKVSRWWYGAVRLPAREVRRAKRLAARRGIAYETLVRNLFQEALDQAESRGGRRRKVRA